MTRIAWRPIWRRFASWVVAGHNYYKAGFAALLQAVGAIAFVVSLWLALGDVFGTSYPIEPIAVPQAFSNNGFTPEVVADRLRDAIEEYTAYADSKRVRMAHRRFELAGNAPDVAVPNIGVSVASFATTLSKVFPPHAKQVISGELVRAGPWLSLRLRVNGENPIEVRARSSDDDPEPLLHEAAKAFLRRYQPFYVALAESKMSAREALWETDRIIARLPSNDDNVMAAYALRAMLFSQLNKPDYALINAQRAGTSSAYAHNSLGVALAAEGRLSEANAQYSIAETIDPKYAAPHNNSGNVAYMNRDLAEAIKQYRIAEKLDPDLGTVHSNLGIVLASAGSIRDAVDEFRRAISLNGYDAQLHEELGNALDQQGDHGLAAQQYAKALLLAPNRDVQSRVRVNIALGNQYRDLRDWQAAEARYAAAASLDKRASYPHDLLGDMFTAQNRTGRAQAEYRTAFRLNHSDYYAASKLPGYALGQRMRAVP